MENVFTFGRHQQRLNWDEYFMGIACVAAKRSQHNFTQEGACVVHEDNRVLGVGYNGLPRGIEESDRIFRSNYDDYCCNAIDNALYYTKEDTKGARIYSTVFPSHENVTHMIQKGIVQVICPSSNPSRGRPKPETLAMMIFEIDPTQENTSTKIYCRPFESSKPSINIEFKEMMNEENFQLAGSLDLK